MSDKKRIICKAVFGVCLLVNVITVLYSVILAMPFPRSLYFFYAVLGSGLILLYLYDKAICTRKEEYNGPPDP